MRFYVYVHIRLDTNEVFYVGKGTKARKDRTSLRNRYWNRIVSKAGFKAEIIKDGLEESEAFALEIEKIKEYKDLGYNLVNSTNGGEGQSGRKHSLETIEKMRQAKLGKKMSQETCEKKRKSMLGKNKGADNCMKNPETIEKMRQSKLGIPPWNKGLKQSQYNQYKKAQEQSNESE